MNVECYLCQNKEFIQRNGKVRDNEDLKIYECSECGLVFLSDFSHIDEAFYENSNMHTNLFDIAHVLKETSEDSLRRYEYLKQNLCNASVLDFGSGAGGFALLAKEIASSISVIEPEKRYTDHYKNHDISVYENIEALGEKKFDLITAFHVIEHLKDPIEILQNLAMHLTPSGKLIIEVPNSEDALLTLYKSEAFSQFTYWSCHLYLFNQSTLARLAQKSKLSIMGIKHVQRYPISNHLYWLSEKKPGGHHTWSGIFSDQLNKEYENSLASIGKTDTLIAILTNNNDN